MLFLDLSARALRKVQVRYDLIIRTNIRRYPILYDFDIKLKMNLMSSKDFVSHSEC